MSLARLIFRVSVRQFFKLDALRVVAGRQDCTRASTPGRSASHVLVLDEFDEEDAGGVQAAVGLLDRGPAPPVDGVEEVVPVLAADHRIGLAQVRADRIGHRLPARAGVADERDVQSIVRCG